MRWSKPVIVSLAFCGLVAADDTTENRGSFGKDVSILICKPRAHGTHHTLRVNANSLQTHLDNGALEGACPIQEPVPAAVPAWENANCNSNLFMGADSPVGECYGHGTCRKKGLNCLCDSGYEGDGTNRCSDIDECLTGTHECDVNAACTNTEGSYECACNAGYIGTGYAGECTKAGIVHEYPEQDLLDAGYTVCYEGGYGQYWTGYNFENDVLPACTGDNIFVGAKESSGSPTIYVGAFGSSSAFSRTGSRNVAVEHDADSGVYWYNHLYYSSSGSFGFGDNENIYLTSADVWAAGWGHGAGDDCANRLSWHRNVGGWRAGCITWLNGNNVWRRVVYHK